MSETVAKKALVPKLRFPGFHGEWSASSIGSQTKILKGRGISKAEVSPKGNIPCIRYGELYTRYGEVIDESFSRTTAAPENLFFSEADDVIVPSSGETKEDIATASCVLRKDVALGGDLNVLRSPNDGRWLSYYLRGALRPELAKVAQGDSVVHLYPDQIARVPIAVPLKPEQIKIADCLQSLDELIAAQTEKLEVLKRHKKGLLQQLFPAEGETTPRLRFPQFRSAPRWQRRSLKDLLSEPPRYGLNAPATDYRKDLPLYLRITDIDDEGRYIQKGQVSVSEVVCSEDYLNLHDIAVARTGASVGKSYYCDGRDGPFVYAGFLIRLRADANRLLPGLLAQWLRSDEYWSWVKLTSARSGQPGINGTEYSAVSVPIPTGSSAIEEQTQISDCLFAADELIGALSAQVESLRVQKSGLMQQLFPAIDEDKDAHIR